MSTSIRKLVRISGVSLSAAALSLIVGLGAPSGARADDADAKRLLKAMFDYMGSQEAISFGFDAALEVITTDNQRLELAGSGDVLLNRPGKIRATRASGHTDFEIVYDGKTLTLFNDNANLYSQISVAGTVDELIDLLVDEYDRPVPGADLILSSAYDELMADVTDIKDLGSGVIDGVECDYLAFRSELVDWQIWIAQGANPYPCRYVIASNDVPQSPQYSIQIRNWKTGSAVASDDFVFKNSTKAKKVDVKDLKGISDLPDNFTLETGAAQ
jgi:hypothetical protein